MSAIAAGLKSAGELLGNNEFLETASEVLDLLQTDFVRGEYFRKGVKDDRVDASLLSIALPFNLVSMDDPVMRRTVEVIRQDLRGATGGIYRYLGDTYFGGGEWILLTAWLGWYDAIIGNRQQCESSRDWVVARANTSLELPEQTTDGVQEPTMIEPWVRRWGPVATPLLWSHAMYLLLSEAAR